MCAKVRVIRATTVNADIKNPRDSTLTASELVNSERN